MELALTFGSVGDIIVLCNIAIKLSRALDLSCSHAAGSAHSYQELRCDLDLFVRILMQVIQTYQERDYSPFLRSLDNTTKAIIDDCAVRIQEALDRFIPRYDKYLRPGGSGHKLLDVSKKIEWAWRDHGRLLTLQEKLRTSTQRLSLMIGIASRASARVDNATMLARIKEVHDLVSQQQREEKILLDLLKRQEQANAQQEARLAIIEKRLEYQEQSNEVVFAIIKAVFGVVSEIKATVFRYTQSFVDQQTSATNSQNLRFLDPTRELPIIFEDALGFRMELPSLEWIRDWDALHTLIECRFRHQKAHSMVEHGFYVLLEDHSGDEIDDSRPLSFSLRRGMKIDMAIVFLDGRQSIYFPRCDYGSGFHKTSDVYENNVGATSDNIRFEVRFQIDSNFIKPTDFQRVALVEGEIRWTLANDPLQPDRVEEKLQYTSVGQPLRHELWHTIGYCPSPGFLAGAAHRPSQISQIPQALFQIMPLPVTEGSKTSSSLGRHFCRRMHNLYPQPPNDACKIMGERMHIVTVHGNKHNNFT